MHSGQHYATLLCTADFQRLENESCHSPPLPLPSQPSPKIIPFLSVYLLYIDFYILYGLLQIIQAFLLRSVDACGLSSR